MEVDILNGLTADVVARVLDWKQKGGVPRIVSMRGGLSGRNTKVRNAE
jgi:hypothetical protein